LAQVADLDMWIRLCLKYEIHVFPEIFVRFRVRENEANTSGNRPETRIRGLYESYKILQNYLNINNFDDLVKIFPASEKYRCKDAGDIGFALAMIALEEKPFCYTPLFGLDILFEAISDAERASTIKRLYEFDYKSFIALTSQYDVFSREELSALWLTKADSDALITNLNENVQSAVTDRDEQKAEVERLQEWIANLNETIQSVVTDRDEQKAEVERLQALNDQQSQEHANQISQLNSLIVERDTQIDKSLTELSALYNSKSWRFTSPLRWLVRKLSRVGRKDVRESQVNLQINDMATAIAENEDGKIVVENDSKFKILLVSYYCPTRAHAGGLRILDIYTLIRQQCPNVQLDLLTYHRPSVDWSLDDVHNIFHNVYLSPQEELTPEVLFALRGSALHYEVIDLQFHQLGYQIDAFREIGKKVNFTPMESLAKVAFINLQSFFMRSNPTDLRKIVASMRLASEEVRFTLKADMVVCVSHSDAKFLRALSLSRHVYGIDTGVSEIEFAEALSPNFVYNLAENRRCNVLYIAYFGSETNISALRWYLDHVHPIVKKNVPDYVFTVVGRGDLSAFSEYKDNSIEFVGEVDTIAPYIQESRVGIAPALAGSGLRGKVNQYAVLGIPSVVSPISHKGLAYEDAENIFVAMKPEEFANRCIKLLVDLELNDRMGQSARELCLANYSWQSKWPEIRKMYDIDKVEC
jgi:glycosyltransferase involved in cell wall biosynthesis